MGGGYSESVCWAKPSHSRAHIDADHSATDASHKRRVLSQGGWEGVSGLPRLAGWVWRWGE